MKNCENCIHNRHCPKDFEDICLYEEIPEGALEPIDFGPPVVEISPEEMFRKLERLHGAFYDKIFELTPKFEV